MISDVDWLCILTAELTQSCTQGMCIRGYTYLRQDGEGLTYFFVSQHVARLALELCGEAEIRLVYTFAKGLQNPALLGWDIEMDFIQRLRDCLPKKEQVRAKAFAK